MHECVSALARLKHEPFRAGEQHEIEGKPMSPRATLLARDRYWQLGSGVAHGDLDPVRRAQSTRKAPGAPPARLVTHPVAEQPRTAPPAYSDLYEQQTLKRQKSAQRYAVGGSLIACCALVGVAIVMIQADLPWWHRLFSLFGVTSALLYLVRPLWKDVERADHAARECYLERDLTLQSNQVARRNRRPHP